MHKMKKAVSIILIFIMLSSMAMLSACSGKDLFVRVIVEEGKHFKVDGESVKTVLRGSDISFKIDIDDGCFYVSNNSGAIFNDGILTLNDVNTPQTVLLNVDITRFIVKLRPVSGMTAYNGGTATTESVTLNVPYGGAASFDVTFDEDYEYIGALAILSDGSDAAVVFTGGKLILNSVRSDTELLVQLRNTAVVTGEKVTVTLQTGDGYTVIGESSKEVEAGDDVSFDVSVQDGYYYIFNNCGAEYLDGKVTLKNVAADQDIYLTFRKKDTLTIYYPHGRVDVVTGAGQTYSAYSDSGYTFTHWVQEGGSSLYSYANNLTVPFDQANSVKLAPVFVATAETQLVVYHANGGQVYSSPDDRVTYGFSSPVYTYPAAFGEWCHKTFYRDGYVPIEYNMKADGSGRAYSLGSRLFEAAKILAVYIIWEKETAADDFLYEDIQSDGVTAIKLTKYKGTDNSVVIPTVIDGKEVRYIAGGCFSGTNITRAVITKNIKAVEKNAFGQCGGLTTVYLCDSVQFIYNDSFQDCPNFAHLRMIAVLPPVYTDHLIGTTIRRFELLYSTMKDTRTNIVFYGGSSIFQGMDGATVQGMFNQSYYRIINGGQNAYISGPLMLDLYSSFMRISDVLVFVPEYGWQQYSNVLELPSWIMFETFYDAFRLLDIRDYGNVMSSFSDHQNGSDNYVYVGKIQQLLDGKALTYEHYNNTLDEYFTRGPNFEIVKASITPSMTPIDYDGLKLLVSNQLNDFYRNKVMIRGITLYFAACGIWEDAFPGGSGQYTMYESWLRSYLKFKYISNSLDHLYAQEYISDSRSHLTREGAVLHSRVLAKEIIYQMRLDGYSV